jgi:CCR4-NOT transcriptional regulation complex NOT5 subunit
MHIQKITFTLLFVAAALAGNAQESKKKLQAKEETKKAAPAPVVDEAPHKGAPIPTSANTPQTQPAQPAPQPVVEQPMQAMPQTTTSGDVPVEAGAIKKPIDRTVKKNMKAKNTSEQFKK